MDINKMMSGIHTMIECVRWHFAVQLLAYHEDDKHKGNETHFHLQNHTCKQEIQ